MVGRLHPFLVHFPIGILFLAFIFEFLGSFKGGKKLRKAVPSILLVGFLASLFAIASGLVLQEEGGYPEETLFRHKVFGLVTTGFSLLLWLVIRFGAGLDKSAMKAVRMVLFIILTASIVVTGHFGGTMTHGEDFIFQQNSSKEKITQIDSKEFIHPELVYRDIVQPILQAKCVSCHGSSKQKGRLRLDSEEMIRKGGKNGMVIGVPTAAGELGRRINLSIEDKAHMPPREKEQLSNTEIELISTWAMLNNPFSDSVKSLRTPALKLWLEENQSEKQKDIWPTAPMEPVTPASLQTLRSSGIILSPIASGSPYLEAIFGNEVDFSGSWYSDWSEALPNIVSIRLSFTSPSEDALAKIISGSQVRRLYLDHTGVSDQAMKLVSALQNLVYLNLTGTNITPEGLETLKNIASLKYLFVYDCKLENDFLKKFIEANPKIKVDTGGYVLPLLPSDTKRYAR